MILSKKRFITTTFSFFLISSQLFCEVFEGITLITNHQFDTGIDFGHVKLIDNSGDIVNEWFTDCAPASIAYLQQDSTLIYPCYHDNSDRLPIGGRIIKYSWENTILWDYLVPEELGTPHHDIEILSNGNILVIMTETKTYEEAINRGRVNIDSDFKLDYIIELEPYGNHEANIVWKWHFWDHLVQDINPNLENFGVISENPGLININLGSSSSLSDWNHLNSIHYNKELVQIVISSRKHNELYIIDHSTSSDEASSHSGGSSGKGGDFLYRWGNVANYDKIDYGQFQLNAQHGVNWIAEDCSNAGNLILFNNKFNSNGNKSAVLELEPIINDDGLYEYDEQFGFLPLTYTWLYEMDFYSSFQSGVFRLPNNNTLITVTAESKIFEINSNENIIWDYASNTARAIKYDINYLTNIQIGDINNDSFINIQDVVLIINLVLNNTYNNLADINSDSVVNVIDIVMVINLILDL